MEPIYQKPMDIEARSMAIIEEHLTGVTLPEPERSILKRVIHTTADFDYTENLCFSENAVSSALEALQRGAHIVTDTNMALSGINKRSLHGLGCEAYCFMSDADVAEEAKARGVTRAMVSMEKACRLDGNLIFCSGKCPDSSDTAGRTDSCRKAAAEADHRRAGGICQCGGSQGTDHGTGAGAVYCGKGAKGRQQCGGGDL